jgi:hypothetical protein
MYTMKFSVVPAPVTLSLMKRSSRIDLHEKEDTTIIKAVFEFEACSTYAPSTRDILCWMAELVLGRVRQTPERAGYS